MPRQISYLPSLLIRNFCWLTLIRLWFYSLAKWSSIATSCCCLFLCFFYIICTCYLSTWNKDIQFNSVHRHWVIFGSTEEFRRFEKLSSFQIVLFFIDQYLFWQHHFKFNLCTFSLLLLSLSVSICQIYIFYDSLLPFKLCNTVFTGVYCDGDFCENS